jgi:hypothetical protein
MPTKNLDVSHARSSSETLLPEACERRVSGFKRFNLCDRLVDTHAQRNGGIPR